MSMGKSSEMDLSNGKLFWKVPKFALPLVLTTLFQLLYTTVDLWTVSTFGGGTLSMTAIASNGALINLIVTFLLNLSNGSGVCMSVAKGEKSDRASKILHTSLLLAVIGGLLVGIFGFFMSPIFLRWMNTPISIIDNATLYLKIIFLGLPFSAVYNFASHMLRALGDSKRPFIISVIAGLANVILDIILVLLGMDVAGVAIATVASHALSALLAIYWFKVNKRGYVNFKWKELKIDKEELKNILKIGIPSGLQGIAFCLPNLLIQTSLYTIDPFILNDIYISQNDIISGSSAAAQIEGYVFGVLNGVSISETSFAGTNYGAKNPGNMKKSFWYHIIWMMSCWAVCSAITLLLYEPLLSIFIKDGEDIVRVAAIEAGKQRLFLLVLTYFLDGIMNICSNYLYGMKNSLVPALVTIVGATGMRILFLTTLFHLPYFHTITWLYSVFPISWIIVDLVYIPIVLTIEKNKFKEIRLSLNN